MHYLTSIGIILALTGILLIFFLKTPLMTSDKLLMLILGTFVVKFLLDEIFLIGGNRFIAGAAAVFGVSSILSCGWYIKYLTDTTSGFGWKQIALYLPLLFLLLLIVLAMVAPLPESDRTFCYNLLLFVMVGLIFYYFYFCIAMLRKHQQLIREYYSGAPGNITVNWIIIILSLQIAEFVLKGFLANFPDKSVGSITPIITNEYCFIIETFLLVVLGIWQKSIPVFIAVNDDTNSSLLNTDDLKRYQQKIEKFMQEHQPYLDPELTIEKLSELTRIRKLSLSQTLNKGFNKNFFTFVKEYRIRHVEDILKNKPRNGATIMDIAYESGFNSKTGFNRAFKEVTGKTPTEYLET